VVNLSFGLPAPVAGVSRLVRMQGAGWFAFLLAASLMVAPFAIGAERPSLDGPDPVPPTEASPNADDRDIGAPRGWRPSGIDQRPVLTNAAQAFALGREGVRATPHKVDFEAVLLMHSAERSFREGRSCAASGL